ncbi:MAG TPA: DUF2071 domain-containing protein [Ktedonobacteraceae bacterium]|nr:DUF2071 domain-containing protein [Ktedonobacteraceae bacterium]
MDTKSIIHTVEHRPYPLPDGPWIMQQEWRDLLFAHYPIAPAQLRPLLPTQLPLDTYDDTCWVGIVPFAMTNVHPRGFFSVPGLSQFPELNVRTYVTVHGIPGVYFFSLEAGNPIAVSLARSLFHLPYFNAAMHIQRVGDAFQYYSHRTHRGAPEADFIARYRPITSTIVLPEPGTLEHWFTERYCLYTTHRGQVYRGNIHHVRWPLQEAEWEVSRNTMAQAHRLPLADTAPLLHFARLQEVLVWPLQQVQHP